MIPWNKIEGKYAKLFPSKTGMPAKPLEMALGSLLIRKQYGFSDEELVEFRKRLPEEILNEVNVCAPDSDFDVMRSGVLIAGLLRSG